jgi:hypothetical protein
MWGNKQVIALPGTQPYRRGGVLGGDSEPLPYLRRSILALRLSRSYNYFHTVGGDGLYKCDVSGQLAGLTAQFSATELRRIPYNQLVEVPFSISNVGGSHLCNNYPNVAVEIVATCEVLTGSEVVYQYGVAVNSTNGEPTVVYDAARRLYTLNSTAFFNVSWVSLSRSLTEDASRLYEESSAILRSVETNSESTSDRLKSIENTIELAAAGVDAVLEVMSNERLLALEANITARIEEQLRASTLKLEEKLQATTTRMEELMVALLMKEAHSTTYPSIDPQLLTVAGAVFVVLEATLGYSTCSCRSCRKRTTIGRLLEAHRDPY